MRRRVVVGLTVLSLLLEVQLVRPASAATLTVCTSGCGYTTIHDAVAAATAGDTITVAPGTYTEQIVIDRNLTLAGAGRGTTIIQAPGSLATDPDGAKTIVLFTGAITGELSGFTIQGPVSGLNFGVYVRAGATANIHDNNIKDIRDAPLSGSQTGVGLEVGKSNDTAPGVTQTGTATITNNTISGYQKTGIAVENTGSSAVITGNTITGAGPTTTIAQNGIQIRRGATGTVRSNTVTGNAYDGPTYSAEGIGALHAGTGVIIQANTVNHNSANIYAWKSDGISILDNQVSDSAPVDQNASAGITVQTNGTPSCCGGATGTSLTAVTISGNTIRSNLSGPSTLSDGIDLYGVSSGTVSNNLISGSSYDGILIGGSGNIVIAGNRFSGNGLLVSDPHAAAIDLGGQPLTNGGANTLGGFTIHNNSFVGNRNGLWNYDGAAVNATTNWWGSATGPTNPSNVGGVGDAASANVNFSTWCADITCAPTVAAILPPGTTTVTTVISTAASVVPTSGGNIATPTGTQPLATYTSGTLTNVDLAAAQIVGDASITVAKSVALVSGTVGTPITLTNPALTTVAVQIPDETNVLAPSGWDGTIAPPAAGSSSGTGPAGFSVGGTVIEVGSPTAVLLFDRAVSVVLAGVTGTVGYRASGSSTWVVIGPCGSAGPVFPGACSTSDGTNTTIHTYHFTAFAGLTPLGGGGGGGGGGGAGAAPTPVTVLPVTSSPGAAPIATTTPVQLPATGVVTVQVTLHGTDGASVTLPQGLTAMTADGQPYRGTIGPPTKVEDPGSLASLFDILIGAPVMFDHSITVTLPVPSGVDPHGLQPVFFDANGRIVYVVGQTTAVSVTFETNRLSRFGLAHVVSPTAHPLSRTFVKAVGYHSLWAGESSWTTLSPGQMADLTVRFVNTGHLGWYRGMLGAQANLGTSNPLDNTRDSDRGIVISPLSNGNRFAAQTESYVGPGDVGTFTFRVRAPDSPGVYQIYVRPVIDGMTWLEDEGVFLQITVK